MPLIQDQGRSSTRLYPFHSRIKLSLMVRSSNKAKNKLDQILIPVAGVSIYSGYRSDHPLWFTLSDSSTIIDAIHDIKVTM